MKITNHRFCYFNSIIPTCNSFYEPTIPSMRYPQASSINALKPSTCTSRVKKIFHYIAFYVLFLFLLFSRKILWVFTGNLNHSNALYQTKLLCKKYVNERNDKALQGLLQDSLTQEPHPVKTLLADPLLYPSPLFIDLLQGANIVFLDGGANYTQWSKIPGCQRRVSSHDDKKGKGYSIAHPLLGECLFWKDQENNTRMQLERHSLSLMDSLYHLQDYLKYKITRKQQGPFGSSPYTDKAPIEVRFLMRP